jgi:hypothetical protein
VFLIAQGIAVVLAFIQHGGIRGQLTKALFIQPIEEVYSDGTVKYHPAFKYLPKIFQYSIQKYHVPAHQKGEDESGAYLSQLSARRSNFSVGCVVATRLDQRKSY